MIGGSRRGVDKIAPAIEPRRDYSASAEKAPEK